MREGREKGRDLDVEHRDDLALFRVVTRDAVHRLGDVLENEIQVQLVTLNRKMRKDGQ
jgi:hypothetical protein